MADALRRALAGSALSVVENHTLRREALKVFDRTFAVTQALRLLAVVVAFIGVWSALLALQVERTRELGTLQALGLLPRQLWGLTLLETGLIGLSAGLLALPTGLLLAVILIEVINVRSFGWTMQLELQPLVLLQAVAVSVTGRSPRRGLPGAPPAAPERGRGAASGVAVSTSSDSRIARLLPSAGPALAPAPQAAPPEHGGRIPAGDR